MLLALQKVTSDVAAEHILLDGMRASQPKDARCFDDCSAVLTATAGDALCQRRQATAAAVT